jgi:tRNA(Ile)-lysidine synthase
MGLVTAEMLTACGVKPEDRLLVGLSGGADSVSLLLSLLELGEQKRIGGLSAAHVNHAIRGASADEDEAYCRTLCEELGIPLRVFKVDAPKYAKDAGMTLEQAARDLRRKALLEALGLEDADYIALAHNREDQAETVLMHLLRGSGLDGLTGIHPVNGPFIRPMLQVSRKEIEAYLVERGRAWQTDETNLSLDYTRNRVRGELMPLLRTFQPQADAAINRAAALLYEDAEYLDKLSEEALERAADEGGWCRACLLKQPAPLRKRALRHILLTLSEDITQKDILRLEALLKSKTGTAIQLRRGKSAWVDGLRLYVGTYPGTRSYQVPFQMPGVTLLPDGSRLKARYVENWHRPEDGSTAFLDPSELPAGTVLRTRQNGDRFRPLGMEGDKLLSDWMTDKKIPRYLRDLPLLCGGNRVYYVAGHGISQEVRLRPDSKQILYLEYKGENRE